MLTNFADMNLMENSFPNGKVFNLLRKKYIIILRTLLSDIEIERCFHAVVVIGENDSCITQQALADKLDIDKVRAGRVVDYLCEAKYIVRCVNTADRRQHILKLTGKGKLRFPIIKNAIQQANEQIFKALSESERVALKAMVSKLLSDLKEIETKNFQFNCKH